MSARNLALTPCRTRTHHRSEAEGVLDRRLAPLSIALRLGGSQAAVARGIIRAERVKATCRNGNEQSHCLSAHNRESFVLLRLLERQDVSWQRLAIAFSHGLQDVCAWNPCRCGL